MLNIVIFGAPGSGKGTQSDFIVKKYGLVHLSTGDILRAEIAKGSEIGKMADSLISKGNFIPDDLMIDILNANIDLYPTAKGFIFDGFPRTLTQAEALDSMLKKRNIKVSLMINIDVQTNELVKRLLERGKTSGRSDDNLQTIHQRLQVYEAKTLPVIQFYDRQGKSNRINGTGTMEEVFARVCKAIDSVNK
ncbi:MAG: adenylate kinase [Paludibacteraceae bacterium]|nr:adenylate kinase [Paludibacteraceae bacterium]